MLFLAMVVTFLGSAHAVPFVMEFFAETMGPLVGAVVAIAIYVSAVLMIARIGMRLRLRNPHLPVAFAFGGLAGAYLPLISVVLRSAGWTGSEDWVSVVLVLGLFAVWGLISDALMRAVLGRATVDAHWSYVKRVYSTFRKD